MPTFYNKSIWLMKKLLVILIFTDRKNGRKKGFDENIKRKIRGSEDLPAQKR